MSVVEGDKNTIFLRPSYLELTLELICFVIPVIKRRNGKNMHVVPFLVVVFGFVVRDSLNEREKVNTCSRFSEIVYGNLRILEGGIPPRPIRLPFLYFYFSATNFQGHLPRHRSCYFLEVLCYPAGKFLRRKGSATQQAHSLQQARDLPNHSPGL